MDDWQKNLVEKKRRKAITKINYENHVFRYINIHS